MKKFFLLIILFQIISLKAYSEVVYIDMNFILNNSEVGKSLNKYLKSLNDKNLAKYKDIENKIVEKEQSLLAQQNILEKIEFDKKFNQLSKEVQKYRSDKKKSLENINKIKLENIKKILDELNPIVTKYVNENSISLVIPKKNIIVGKKNLEITEEILKLLDKKVKKLNLEWKTFFLKKKNISRLIIFY